MRCALLLLVLVVGNDNQKQANKEATDSAQHKNASPPQVTVVNAVTTNAGNNDSEQNQTKPARKSAPLISLYELISLFFTAVYIAVSIAMWRAIKKQGDEMESQSGAMEKSIAQAVRSAAATEKIVGVIESGNKAITRAYVTIIIGGATYQERTRPGQADIKFAGNPTLTNTGNTPAHKVVASIKAAILPSPLPNGFVFPEPTPFHDARGTSVAPRQNNILTAMVDNFVPDAEVAAIKECQGEALYTWGIVTYEDVFGEQHFTRFGQQLFWGPNNAVMGFFLDGLNDSN